MVSKTKKILVAAAALVGWGSASHAGAQLPAESARILEIGECRASTEYSLLRTRVANAYGTRPERNRETSAEMACGLGSRWQLEAEGVHQDLDDGGYGRGLHLGARFGLVQSKDQAVSLGMRAEWLRRWDVPGSLPGDFERTRFSQLEFNLRGEQRLGESHRLTADFTQGRLRGGDSGPWTATFGYGYRLSADWELLGVLSKTQRQGGRLGLGLNWAPQASPWSVGLMLQPEERSGVMSKGLRLGASYRF